MLGLKKPGDAGRGARTRAVREWAREAWGVGPDVTVLVTELTCTEPGCPPVETVIAVMRGPGDNLQVKIPRALTELTQDDVRAATLAPAPAAPTTPSE